MRISFSSLASAALLLAASPVHAQVNASSTYCGQVFNSSSYYLSAKDVYACLSTAPFNKTLASDLVEYWQDTLQFQSTLAYLENPTNAYQQNSVDLLGGLDLIQNQIDNGVFLSQYSFEAAVHSLLQQSHDFHISLTGGVMQAFTFTPNIPFVSISVDGFALPQVYHGDDVFDWVSGSPYTPSPIVAVNGEIAEAWFEDYASRNSYGGIEPHGDWNQIMWTYPASIQGYYDPFSSVFYNGDALTLQFANGTVNNYEWQAVYVGDSDFPLIITGQDLYDWFVLGQDTQSDIAMYGNATASATASGTAAATATDDEAPSLTSVAAAATSTSSDSGNGTGNDTILGWGYPYPDVANVSQYDLGGNGYVTGYYLHNSKIGVLSIPTFTIVAEPDAAQNFTDTVSAFLNGAKEAGMEKIVVDLQQNYGGEQLLAAQTFKQFFPNIEPFEGMRTRSTELSNQLGQIINGFFAQYYNTFNETVVEEFLNDPWAVANELDAGTGQYFASWDEYFGPHYDNEDYFSTVFRFNFSNPLFEWVADYIDINDAAPPATAPYEAEDIVILTDSVCASTCDLFVEMMHHQAGVRTVVIGGMPQVGPMQARGSTRGALALANWQVDNNLYLASAINNTIIPYLFDRDPSFTSLFNLQFNFADQIRESEYVPLQFVYEAADCRIFWTPQTYFNYTLLWEYAASAVFFNASTCVAHSAEHNNTMQTDIWGPSDEQLQAWQSTNPAYASYNTSNMSVPWTISEVNFWVGVNLDLSGFNTPLKVNGCGFGGCVSARPPPKQSQPRYPNNQQQSTNGVRTPANSNLGGWRAPKRSSGSSLSGNNYSPVGSSNLGGDGSFQSTPDLPSLPSGEQTVSTPEEVGRERRRRRGLAKRDGKKKRARFV